MCSTKFTAEWQDEISTAVPGYEDVDETFVSVESCRNVFFNPLVDRLRGGIHFDLFQQLLFQFHEWKQEAQTFPFQNLQHLIGLLVDFYKSIYKKVNTSKNSYGYMIPQHSWAQPYQVAFSAC